MLRTADSYQTGTALVTSLCICTDYSLLLCQPPKAILHNFTDDRVQRTEKIFLESSRTKN